jgi:RNA polymerase nonessential primary-like sigma factor
MGSSSVAVRRLTARVERERLARARAEGVAEGMERALEMLLSRRQHARKPRMAVRGAAVVARALAEAKAAAVPPAPSPRAAAPRPKAPDAPGKASTPPPSPAAPRRARTRKAASARAAPAPQRARARERKPPRVRVQPAPLPPAAPEAVEGGLATLLSGAPASALEAAVARVRASRPASAQEKAATTEVLRRIQPWVVGAARSEYSARARRLGVEQEELVQVGLVAVAEHCRRFTPGRAGKGRTLFPAYALRVARQAMGRLVQENRSVVPLTSWGLKLRRRAQRRASAEGVELRQALESEGASPASVLALEQGVVEVVSMSPRGLGRGGGGVRRGTGGASQPSAVDPLVTTAELQAHEEAAEHRAQLQLGEAAMEALRKLPALVRQAVAGPLGLEGPATPVRVLAVRMGLEEAEVQQLHLQGLAALRACLESE